MRSILRSLLLLTLFIADDTMAADAVLPNLTPAPGIDFIIPFDGRGKLVTVRAASPYHPDYSTATFVTARGTQHRVGIDKSRVTRWYGHDRLLHRIDVRRDAQTLLSEYVLSDLNGQILQTLGGQGGAWGMQPSPDGSWVAMLRTPDRGPTLLEVHALPANKEAPFPELTPQPRPETKDFSHPTWSPDSKMLAVAAWPVEPSGKLWPRLALYDFHTHAVQRIEDGLVKGVREPGGTKPLLWTQAGLFAASDERILRCDPAGGGCTLFHTLAAHLRVHSAVAIGGGKALVLLRDLSADPFDTRAVEIHTLDLQQGGTQRLVRTPPGVFLESLDWIASD